MRHISHFAFYSSHPTHSWWPWAWIDSKYNHNNNNNNTKQHQHHAPLIVRRLHSLCSSTSERVAESLCSNVKVGSSPSFASIHTRGGRNNYHHSEHSIRCIISICICTCFFSLIFLSV